MKAVILAAGEGSRMRPLTYTTPKPLLEVAAKPVLEWIIESVRPHIDGVVLVIGHLREKIREHFGGRWGGLSISYVHQAEQRGTGHALQICREALRGADRFFVIYGDNISAPSDMANCAKHPLAALAIPVADPGKYGIFKVDATGRLLDLIEKPRENVGNLANAGVYIFDQSIFDELDRTTVSDRGEIELTDAVLKLARRERVQVVNVEGYWLPVGYRDDIAKAEPILLGREPGAAEFLAQRKRTLTAALGLMHRALQRRLDEIASGGEVSKKSPAPGRMSVLDLVRHLAMGERFVRAMILGESVRSVKAPTPEETRDLASARRVFDQEREATMSLLRDLDGHALDRVLTLTPPDGGEEIHLTVEEFLIFLSQHEAWHAGQVSWAQRILAPAGQ